MGVRWHAIGRRRLAVAVGITLCLSLDVSPPAMAASAPVTKSNPGKPNRFDPTSASTSINHVPVAAPSPSPAWDSASGLAMHKGTSFSVQPTTFRVSTNSATKFVSTDGSLEIDVPSDAVSSADLAADGGETNLFVRQVLPASGSSAGSTGHISFGTFLIQVTDSRGRLSHHGLLKPIGLRLHYPAQAGAVDLAHAYAVINGAVPIDVNPDPLADPGAVPSAPTSIALGPLSTTTATVDPTTQTLSTLAAVATASTSASFGTNAPVAVFGKPQPFEVDLGGASLTAAYPIDVPAGPKGFKPPLNLTYNSAGVTDQHNAQGAAPWVGEGWNMSLGAISWSEHYVDETGGTAHWQDSWELSDPFGAAATLIPPATNTAIWFEDANAMTSNAVQWHTAPETYARVYSFQSANTLPGATNKAPCFRVFLTNGIMEEFGCTPDSIEYYFEPSGTNVGKPYISSWNLDLITEPDGNQIQITYQRDMVTSGSNQYPRDAVLSSIAWDSPNCRNATTACTATGAIPNQWAPLMQVVFSAGHNVAHINGASCTGANNLRCDDPADLTASSGLAAPSVQSDFVLNDILVQINDGSNGIHNLRDYELFYDQAVPQAPIVDPVSGKSESVAGRLLLTKMVVIGADGSASMPATTFGYTQVLEYYIDSLINPTPTTNCGPAWNKGDTRFSGQTCKLWSQSYGGNSYFMSSVSNGIGMSQTFSWADLRDNMHGVTSGGDTGDPLYCTNAQAGVSGYSGGSLFPCDMADDETWGHVGITGMTNSLVRVSQNGQGGAQTSTPVNGTTTYTYRVIANLAAQECPTCIAGFSWGNQDDNDYLDFYNGKFMGFPQVTISNPDGSVDVHKYYSTEGWGTWTTDHTQLTITCPASPPDVCHFDPWWDTANQTTYPGQSNALHGHEYELDRYDTNGTTLLQQVLTSYSSTCPPAWLAGGSPPVTAYGAWAGNLVSSLDLGNPMALCDVQTTSVDTKTFDGASGTVPDRTVTYTYESGARPCTSCYGRELSEKTVANDGSASGSPTTLVNAVRYVWNDAVSVTSTSATGAYLIAFPAQTDTEDASGANRYQCAYTTYDGMAANTTGPSASLLKGDVTRQDRYTSCGVSPSFTPSGPITTTQGYTDGSTTAAGNQIFSDDPDANAGNTTHQGCTGYAANHSVCTFYDGYFQALQVSHSNALNQSSGTHYFAHEGADAAHGWGLWPDYNYDANGQITSFQYDMLGRQTAVTLPGETAGLTTQTMAYNVWCTGTAAQTPCAEIDQTQRIDPNTTVTSRGFYDGMGHLVETRSPGAGGDVVQYYTYDTSQRLAFKSVSYFVTAYSGASGAAAYSIPDSTVVGTAYAYDGLDRSTTTTDAQSHATTNSYSVVCNAAGTGDAACYEQTATVDALGHKASSLVDALGRTNYGQRFTGNSTATYAVYATTKSTYDFTGHLTQILQPDGVTKTQFVYDMAGRRTSMTDPDRGGESYFYDQDGNLVQSVDARGTAGTYFVGYDGIDRPMWHNTTNSSTGAYDIYTYDATASGNMGVGRLTGETFSGSPVNSLSGGYSYTYDARGEQLAAVLTVGSTSYTNSMTYDDAGNVRTQTYPTNETVTNAYSPQGWLTGVSTQSQTGTVTSIVANATYSQGANQFGGPAGQITSATIGSIYLYSASYDALMRNTDVKFANGATTEFEQTRSFDAAGNVTAATTTVPAGTDVQAFCFDEQNRLTWAGSAGTPPCTGVAISPGTLTAAQYTQSFSYDNMGRLTSGPLGAYSYGNAAHVHATTAIGAGYTAAYDAAGNMTCRAPSSTATCAGTPTGAQLTFNNEGMLAAWQNQPSNATTTATYLYDGQGARVAQQTVSGGVTTTTVYVGGTEQATYVVGGTSTSTPLSAPVRTGGASTKPSTSQSPNSIGCLTGPTAPTNVTATAGNAQATVHWKPGTPTTGMCAITSYTVVSTPGSIQTTVTGATTSSATVTGLTNGTTYTFIVYAQNPGDVSPDSSPSNAVTPTGTSTVPGAPTGVTATAGNGQATVTWSAPASNGGSAITSYKVTSSPGGLTATTPNGTTTSATVTGLTNGTSYTFTVTAANSVGTGPASAASNAVVPAAPPGAPTTVTATAGNGQATVSWTAPASNGGAAISKYTVTSAPGGLTATTANGSTTTATVTGLTNGTAYTFTVTATNSAGTGPSSAASNSVTPATVPGAPTGVTATAGNAQATVSWTAPASNGGAAISSYKVTSSPGGLTATTPNGTTTTATVTGLTNGTAYTFTVTATNSAGTGAASAPSNSVTPVAVPGAPTAVTATAGNAQATVTWTAPTNVGGGAIISYTVTSTPGGLTATTADGTTTTATVTGLTNGTAYTFTVTATNSFGTGPASAPSNAVTPATVPGAPTSVIATRGNAQATVSWTAPASNGGSAITSYTVTSSPGGFSSTTANGVTTTATVTGLTNGTSYTFTVTATNALGTGAPSAPSNAVVPASVPGAPTGVIATGGNAQATVSWTAPASNGGSAITAYTVTSSPGGLSATTANGTTTTATVAGLTNGTSYTFTVTATNAVGTGPASVASNAVTPATVPGNPTNVTATAGNAQATVSWTAPASNGGAAISTYTVTSSPGGLTATTANGSTTTATVAGLTNGIAYTFTVTATNSVGTGPASAASNSVTPVGPPGAPTGVTASGGNAQATVSWTAPASNGGAAITKYTVTSSPGGLTATTADGMTTTATVTGLTNGAAYTFTVTASNSAGTGAPSAPSNTVTPATVPGAPTAVTATAGNTQATVSWTAPASNGGAAITSYTVTSSPGALTVSTANGTTTTATITGLTNGTAYTFTVTATNASGTGAASTASNSVTPAGPPSAPTNVAATAGTAQATVTWTAPASNGGAAITSYTVTSSPGGLTAVTANGTTTSATVAGLTNGTAYTFTVTATNPAGTSAASNPSNSVTPAAPPGAPSNVTASGGMGQATVTWTAPPSNGGAITGYTVTSTPGALTSTVGGGATTATVVGLTNGTSYTFTVTATNWAGTSAPSAPSNAVTPGITVRTYYYANGLRFAVAVNGVFTYLGSDGLGSGDVALGTGGSATAVTLFAPYGSVRFASGTMPSDYGFTGQHTDTSDGLVYLGARYYDPTAAQFASADTVLPGDGFDAWGLSRYAYVEGEPELRTDPTGHDSDWCRGSPLCGGGGGGCWPICSPWNSDMQYIDGGLEVRIQNQQPTGTIGGQDPVALPVQKTYTYSPSGTRPTITLKPRTGTATLDDPLGQILRALAALLAIVVAKTLLESLSYLLSNYPKSKTGKGSTPKQDRDPQRLFNPKQKQQISDKTGGTCARCGNNLEDGWNAHHKDRWSDGGQTDPSNGDPLCTDCHRWVHGGPQFF